MKKFKQLLVALLMCCVIIVPMTACGENNKVSGIVQSCQMDEENEYLTILYKSDITLQEKYWCFRVTEGDLQQFNNSLSEFLSDESTIAHCRYGFSETLPTNNRQSTTYCPASYYIVYILIYPFSALPEDKTLFDYVGKIELT